MRFKALFIILTLAFQSFAFDYPKTLTKPTVQNKFGVEIQDPYRWLESIDSPEVNNWISNQNQFADLYFSKNTNRNVLRSKFKKILDRDMDSPPVQVGEKTFFFKRKAGKRTILYMKTKSQKEKVVFDANRLSSDDAVGSFKFSKDGELIVYTVARNNMDLATAFVRKVSTGEDLKVDQIEGLERTSFNLAPDDKGFYYIHLPDTDLQQDHSNLYQNATLKYHQFNTPQSQDLALFFSNGKYNYIDMEIHGKWLFLTAFNGDSYDYFIKNLELPLAKLESVSLPSPYQIDAFENWIYVRTNQYHSNFSLVRIDVDKIASGRWETVIPGQFNSTLEDFSIWGGRLFLKYIDQGFSRIFSATPEGSQSIEITLPEGLMPDLPYAEAHETEGFLLGDSMISPTKTFRISSRDLKPILDNSNEYGNDINPSQYLQKNIEYQSEGSLVTMHLAMSKKTQLQGSMPILLSVYGGFCENMLPIFDPSIIPWLDAGGGFAIIQARGGCEKGSAWHSAAIGKNKKNTFLDVISAAEYLLQKGYTSKGKLALMGSSNGGLTVGAAIVMRPDLFRAAISGVPLFDMVRYTEVGSSGQWWISEYGDPSKEDDFKYLLSYSPYQNIKAGIHYPSILINSSQNDDRVHPMHARKMTAALQSLGSKNIVLLRTELNAGHSGSANFQKQIDSLADKYTFLMNELKINLE